MNPVSSTQRYQTSSPIISSQPENPGFFKKVEGCLSWLFGTSTPKQPSQQRLLERVSEKAILTNSGSKSEPVAKIEKFVFDGQVLQFDNGCYGIYIDTQDHLPLPTDFDVTKINVKLFNGVHPSKIHVLTKDQYETIKRTGEIKKDQLQKVKKEPLPTVAPKMIKPKEESQTIPKIELELNGPTLAEKLGYEGSSMKTLLEPYIGRDVYVGGWAIYADDEIVALHDLMRENKGLGKTFAFDCFLQDVKALTKLFQNDEKFYVKSIKYKEIEYDGKMEALYFCHLLNK